MTGRLRGAFLLFAAAVVLVPAFPALITGPQEKAVAKHPIDVWLEQCTAKDESTYGQIQCLNEAYKKWDAELNRVYQELMKKLPEAGRAALKSAQLAWIRHRNEEFNLLTALYEMFDGTMYGLMKVADQVDFVRKRALELSSYLSVIDIG